MNWHILFRLHNEFCRMKLEEAMNFTSICIKIHVINIWSYPKTRHPGNLYKKYTICCKTCKYSSLTKYQYSQKFPDTTHNITVYAITYKWKLNYKDHTHERWWNTHQIDTCYPKHLWTYVTPCMFLILCTMTLATTCVSISQYETKVTKSM